MPPLISAVWANLAGVANVAVGADTGAVAYRTMATAFDAL